MIADSNGGGGVFYVVDIEGGGDINSYKWCRWRSVLSVQ